MSKRPFFLDNKPVPLRDAAEIVKQDGTGKPLAFRDRRWEEVKWVEAESNGSEPKEAASTPAGRRTSWTAEDLLSVEFPEPRYAVDGLLPEGLTFTCGSPKMGKSWMALGLAISVASGGKALGSIPVERGEVLYLALEDGDRRLQTRLRTLLAGDSPPQGLHLETVWPRLDEGGTDQLDAWLSDHPAARLVVIDVYSRVRPRVHKPTDYYQADYDAATPLQVLAVTHGIAIVALYHTRKAESEDFVETVSGTFGTAAVADTIVVVKRSRGQADATLCVTGRDVEERELALRFAADAGTWTILGEALEYKVGETRREILEAIRATGSPMSPKQLAEDTDRDHDLVKQTVRRMAAAGQLKVVKRGWYALSPSSLSHSPEQQEGDSGD